MLVSILNIKKEGNSTPPNFYGTPSDRNAIPINRVFFFLLKTVQEAQMVNFIKREQYVQD
jgi:hypothetical protein